VVGVGVATDLDSYRLFHCPRCHAPVAVCRACDRGHVYCRPCAPAARREACRDYNRTYRRTDRGRDSARRRQAAFRAQRWAAAEAVTHHGSPIPVPEGEVRVPVVATPSEATHDAATPPREIEIHGRTIEDPVAPLRCVLCGVLLPLLARRGFLRPPPRRHRRGARPRAIWREPP
jgi:hypothetical protein